MKYKRDRLKFRITLGRYPSRGARRSAKVTDAWTEYRRRDSGFDNENHVERRYLERKKTTAIKTKKQFHLNRTNHAKQDNKSRKQWPRPVVDHP